MRERMISILAVISKPAVAIGGGLVIGAGILGFTWYGATHEPSGSYVPVTEGPITQEVDVIGTVKASQSTDLSFQTSGRVAVINVAVGDHVNAGQTLVALDTSSQAAATALAQANLESQQANLAQLASGTRPEQLAIDETAVTQAQNGLVSALQTAYASADDAVHDDADQVFSTPRSTAVFTLTIPNDLLVNGSTQNATAFIDQLESERDAIEPIFATWSAQLASTSADTNATALSSEGYMNTILSFMDDLTTATAEAVPSGSITQSMISGYQASIAAGRLEVAQALSGVIAADSAYTSATGALTLAQEGATANDIAAQQAVVTAAQASLDAALAASSQAVITAPVSGTITVQNANLGQTVVPGTPLVSMIADGLYQADAEVSENDIAEVKVNDPVDVTFDAYPGVIFTATVTTVDPAATMDSNGVASYGVTITFTNNDPRLLSGLSANMRIITATQNSALLVPTSAIITNGTEQFVNVQGSHGPTEVPVTTGVQSATGMTQILSGLTQGQEVLTFGSAPQ
jgi:HlyD family secretion protein